MAPNRRWILLIISIYILSCVFLFITGWICAIYRVPLYSSVSILIGAFIFLLVVVSNYIDKKRAPYVLNQVKEKWACRCPVCFNETDFELRGFSRNILVCRSCSAEWLLFISEWMFKVTSAMLTKVSVDLKGWNLLRKKHPISFWSSLVERFLFEREQMAKGLVKFVDRFGNERWGKPEQIEQWKKEDFEKQQLAKGLVKYRGKWVTPFEREQMERGLVKFVDRIWHERWGTPEQVREWKIIDIGMKENFASLTPREFEELVADLFAKMKYQVRLTQKIADYGADIIAKKGEDTLVIEVCRYKIGNNVGNQEV